MRLLSFAVLAGTAVALQPLPPVQWTNTNALSNGFNGLTTANSSKTIYIENAFADVADTEGTTLIPPTAFQFAQTFRQDLANWTNANWTLQRVDSFPENAATNASPTSADRQRFFAARWPHSRCPSICDSWLHARCRSQVVRTRISERVVYLRILLQNLGISLPQQRQRTSQQGT